MINFLCHPINQLSINNSQSHVLKNHPLTPLKYAFFLLLLNNIDKSKKHCINKMKIDIVYLLHNILHHL